MTNQQGAPEALTVVAPTKAQIIEGLRAVQSGIGPRRPEIYDQPDRNRWDYIDAACAALVEAQQPATVQPVAQQGAATNDADAEEVDAVIACLGDDAATLREQNPECEMAANMDRAAELLALRTQQPAPSAAEIEGGPPGSGGWEKHAIEMERQRDYYRQRCHTMEEHQNGGVWYWQGDDGDSLESMGNSMLVVIRADQLRSLMQPSPTPQADSQPAPDLEEVLSAARNWGEVQQYNRTDGKGTEYRITFNVHQRAAHFARELLAASAPADSEVARLRAALVYTAYALHATPQYMLAEGITLIDGDTVRVSRDGWTVEASANPARATPPTQAQAGAVPLTKEQRSRIVLTADTVSEAIDMVERHHGIKGGQHGDV